MKNFAMVYFVVFVLVILSGITNADYLLRITAQSPHNWPQVYVLHLDSEFTKEGFDGDDSIAPTNPNNTRIEFYSINPVAGSHPNADSDELTVDARPIDSFSTYTCGVEGVNLADPNAPTYLTFENRLGVYPGKNVIASFYDNEGTTADPNWIYAGITLDAQQAGETPSTSYITVYVENGISNIFQVKFFPSEDINFSGDVDLADFAKLSENWQTTFGTDIRTPYSPMDSPEYYSDINKDGTVNILDLADLCAFWLWQKPAYEIDCYDPINPDLSQCP